MLAVSFKMKAKRNPFKSLYIPERIIADMTYPNYSIDERELAKVRFLLSPIKDYKKSFALIIIAQPSISPMQYGYETFPLIKAFLENNDIHLDQVEIILDYAQRTGIEKGNTSKWIFKTDHKGEYLEDSLANIEESLSEEIQSIRGKYYNEFNIKIQ